MSGKAWQQAGMATGTGSREIHLNHTQKPGNGGRLSTFPQNRDNNSKTLLTKTKTKQHQKHPTKNNWNSQVVVGVVATPLIPAEAGGSWS